MMNPFFKSKHQYDAYIHCLNNIQIGDEVECLLVNNQLVSDMGINMVYGTYRYGDTWSASKIILPIIGKMYSLNSDKYYTTVVGVSNAIYQKCRNAYRQVLSDNLNINKSNKDYLIYCNSNFDIIYSKIIKKV